jgi:Ca2+-binding RTX toxin-like protein
MERGDVSQLDIENSLRFNNGLTLLDLSVTELKQVIEWSVAASGEGKTPGQFGQFGGLAFTYDLTGTAIAFDNNGVMTTEGTRVRDLAIINDDGEIVQRLYTDGVLTAGIDPNQVIRVVTLNFLANAGTGTPGRGGDAYPFPAFLDPATRNDLLGDPLPGDLQNVATFAAIGSEQDALAEYMAALFPADERGDTTNASTFDVADTSAKIDLRIQNLTDSGTDRPNGFTVLSLTGTAGDDDLGGGFFDDTISGQGGDDLIYGFAGDDDLDGGLGGDMMLGGAGNDAYTVDDVGDIVKEVDGQGTDTVRLAISYALGPNVENLTLVGSTAIDGTGNALGNVIIGNGAANVLDGGDGDDTLDGGGGADDLNGGRGNDIYSVGATGDDVTEATDEGTDTVNASVTYALTGNVENLTLTGSAAINGTGNGLGNIIIGNGAANVLDGADGDDRIDGGAGNDSMFGGDGNDTFIGTPAGSDSYDGGSGIDTLDFSSLTPPITLTLKDRSAVFGSGTVVNIENVLGGSGNDVITGNGQANLLRGNVGDDKLNGGNGNDVLHGGSGRDTLDGGAGDDVLIGGFGNDILTGGGGVDRFVFDSLNDARDTIKDFKVTGNAQDFLVFDPGMFTGFTGDDGTDLVAGGFMRTIASGGSTQVQLDLNGGANAWATIAELTGTFTLDQVKTHTLVQDYPM